MGIDLKILASQFRERRGEFLATATLRFDRDATPFSQLSGEANPLSRSSSACRSEGRAL